MPGANPKEKNVAVVEKVQTMCYLNATVAAPRVGIHERLHTNMSLPIAIVIIVSFLVVGGALTLAGFVWAVHTKQFSVRQLNEGAKLIFDDDEPIGTPQDLLFKKSINDSPDPR